MLAWAIILHNFLKFKFVKNFKYSKNIKNTL